MIFTVGFQLTNGFHGEGNGTIFSVTCTGAEARLAACTIRNDRTGCSHSQDGAVLCVGMFVACSICLNLILYMMLIITDPGCTEGEVRLFNNQSSDGVVMGQVELCRTTAGFRTKVCDTNWDNHDAEVVCRELGLLYGRSV